MCEGQRQLRLLDYEVIKNFYNKINTFLRSRWKDAMMIMVVVWYYLFLSWKVWRSKERWDAKEADVSHDEFLTTVCSLRIQWEVDLQGCSSQKPRVSSPSYNDEQTTVHALEFPTEVEAINTPLNDVYSLQVISVNHKECLQQTKPLPLIARPAQYQAKSSLDIS